MKPLPNSNPDLKRIGELITKSLSGTSNLDEDVELAKWLSESKQNQRLFLKIQDDLLTKINNDNKKLKNIKYRSIAIATSVLLIASFSLLHLYKSKDKSAYIPSQTKSFSYPSGIILTLENGLNLNIDSVNSPIRQGDMLLTKNGNEITYIQVPKYPKKEGFNTLRTMFGKQIKIVFQDGSKVWLNAGSTIHYPTSFNNKIRKVNITGEAFFEVAPISDTTQQENKIPFVVSINDIEITVLGTKFNVRAYSEDNEIKTSLLEGSISLKKNNRSYLLYPGQQAIISNNNVNVFTSFDQEEVVSWKINRFKFKDLQIEPLMHEISRWYNVTVVYEDVIMDQFTLNVPRNIPLAELLKILELTSSAHFKIENNTVFCSK